jgi:hypothetical protein
VPIFKRAASLQCCTARPNNGGTPCFATFSLLWQRSFCLPPALFPMTLLLVAAEDLEVEAFEVEDFMEAACAPVASAAVDSMAAVWVPPTSGAEPFMPVVSALRDAVMDTVP